MGDADNGNHVMFAMTLKVDVAQQHHLVIAIGLFEGTREHVDRICIVSGEELFIGSGDSIRRAQQALTIGIVAGPSQQCADRRFSLIARRFGQTWR